MSGTNRLVNSNNTIKGNNVNTLKNALANANTVAKGIKEIPMKNKVSKNK